MVRPGVYMEDLHREAERIIAEAGFADYFIHSLGHFVGLDVHDAGIYSEPLQKNMVITIEPGIYVTGWGGVRIEDMVVLENGKARPLTRASKSRR